MQNYSSLQDIQDQEEQGILFHVAEPTRSKWNHIEDLDSFFTRMYKYHQRHGFLCMLLQEIFKLNQFVFVVTLSIYLIHGINYPVLFHYGPEQKQKITLNDVIFPLGQCLSNFTALTWFCVIIAIVYLILKIITKFYQMIAFWDIKQFYNTALGIEDKNLDNMTWHEIQAKIKIAQLEHQMCIHKRELTELDIYHRILRQENYLVAMVNKRLLPPRFNVPFVGEVVYWTSGLRYNIQGLLFWSPWSLFENPWHLREMYKKPNMRHELARQLGRQILWLALINIILAPVILVWQIVYTFFNYAELIKREPGKIGIRNWSLYGKLYVRHFNELDHELHARLTRAYSPATKYMAAFSSPVITIIAQHIEFLCGAIFAVIVGLTIYDEDVIAVENVLTLMTGLGALIAICRGVIPDDTMYWCPDALLQAVVMHTHYLPPNWQGRAHTAKTRHEVQQLFQYRFVSMFEDTFSPVLTPYVLVFFVYPRSLEIVDFFRNFTVAVVGVGDVCSFAQMDVKKHGNPDWHPEQISMTSGTDLQAQYAQAEDGKVELSLVHFTTTNPSWIPPPEAQEFVNNIHEEMAPVYQDSEAMFFTSVNNLLESSSLDFNSQSLANFRRNLRGFKSSYRGDTTQSSTGFKTSVFAAEGPDEMAPISMTNSVLALHDINYKQGERRRLSIAQESTPLLTPKSAF